MGNETYTIPYDYAIPTATYLEGAAVKPDIVILDRVEKVATLVEVSVPDDAELNWAEIDKKTKYKDLIYDMKKKTLVSGRLTSSLLS